MIESEFGSLHWWWNINLHQVPEEPQANDTLAVVAARGMILAYRDLDGIADEMSFTEIDRCNELMKYVGPALETLGYRPKPVPNTQEQNIAFRKAWDARVEAGQKKV
jgi:hypothetical protein